jgi:hypothetical protein
VDTALVKGVSEGRPNLWCIQAKWYEPWKWPRLELAGYGVWLLAGAMFAIPELWASTDSDLGFPTLSNTVGSLERRQEIVSLVVVLVIANALLHGVRVGATVMAKRRDPPAPAAAGTDDPLAEAQAVPTVRLKSKQTWRS